MRARIESDLSLSLFLDHEVEEQREKKKSAINDVREMTWVLLMSIIKWRPYASTKSVLILRVTLWFVHTLFDLLEREKSQNILFKKG